MFIVHSVTLQPDGWIGLGFKGEKSIFFSILALFSWARKRLKNAGETFTDLREWGVRVFDHFKKPTYN
jgi:hypothetical protein